MGLGIFFGKFFVKWWFRDLRVFYFEVLLFWEFFIFSCEERGEGNRDAGEDVEKVSLFWKVFVWKWFMLYLFIFISYILVYYFI